MDSTAHFPAGRCIGATSPKRFAAEALAHVARGPRSSHCAGASDGRGPQARLLLAGAAAAVCLAAAAAGIAASSEKPTAEPRHPPGAQAPLALRYAGRVADGDRGAGGEPVLLRRPGSLAVRGDGGAVYVGTEPGLLEFARDAETGALGPARFAVRDVDVSRARLAWDAVGQRLLADDCGAWRTFPMTADDDGAHLAEGGELVAEDDPHTCGGGLHISKDGASVYRVSPGRIDVFNAELAARLRFVQTLEAPGLTHAAPAPGGALYALANDALLVFEPDGRTGLLAPVGEPVPLAAPATALAITADGARLYVVEADGAGLGVFDLATPERPRRVAAAQLPVAPDAGACPFAAAVPGVAAVDVFCNRAAFGAHWPTGAGDAETWTAAAVADPLPHERPMAVAASPDGRNVYVATPTSGVLIFARDGAPRAATHASGGDAGNPTAAYPPGGTVLGVPGRARYTPYDETGPDLIMEGPRIVRTSFTGRQFRVVVNVRNQAATTNAKPTLTFHRSTDDAVISIDDTVVDRQVISPGSAWVEYGSEVQVPPSGAYYGACVEAVAGELNTDNNCSAGVFAAMGAPDLSVAVAISKAAPGKPFQLTATIRNGGADRSPVAKLNFHFSEHLSVDGAVNHSDRVAKSVELAPLASGAEAKETIRTSAPSGARAYYYGACIEAVAHELDTRNNCSAAVATSTEEPDEPDDWADTINLGDIGAAYGIAYHDDRLYVVDNDADEVRAYDRSGARDAARGFALQDGNGNTNGMAYANGRFFVLDSADDKVYAYFTDGSRDAEGDFDLAKGAPAGTESNLDASGIVHAYGRFLVVDYADRKVYAYASDGSRDAASDFALAADVPVEPTGIAHAGTRFYVLGDGRAFAYLGGQRDPESDLVLDADNADASGITHAASFFVLDRADRKIYVYDVGDFFLQGGSYTNIAYADDILYAVGIKLPWLTSMVEAYGTGGARLDFDLNGSNLNAFGMAHADGTLYVVEFGSMSGGNDYGFGVYAYGMDGGRRSAQDFNLDEDNGHPRGIAHAGGAFYVVDSRDEKVYAYGADGARRDGLDFDLDEDNGDPRGIAHAGGAFYVVDSRDEKVYAYGADGARRDPLDFDLDEDNGDPRGIAHADGAFYVVDWIDEKVYAYGMDGSRRPAEDFHLTGYNHSPTDVAYVADTLYLVDHEHSVVYAYGMDGRRRSARDFDLDEDNGHPLGIAHAAGAFYVPDGEDNKVYAYATDGSRRSDLDFDLDGNNRDPRGIAHAAGAFYVPDVEDNKVYAYGADGSRRSAQDFDLDEDNDSPQGIAHADGAFYVVDPPDEKVYAYGADGTRRSAEDFYLYRQNNFPIGLAQAGDTLYVVEWLLIAGRVYAYGADRPRAFGEYFDLDEGHYSARGYYMAHAGGTLYLVETDWHSVDCCKVYAYGTDGARRPAEEFDLNEDNDSPRGIAHAAGAFYVPDVEDNKVYAYGADGRRRPAEDFDLDEDNSDPIGIAHAGGTLYVVDSRDDKVYAYGADGTRRSAEDFDLDEDNSYPIGIAHAGDTLYVVDSFDEKVYAYSTDGTRRSAQDFYLHLANASPSGAAHADGRLYVADRNDHKVYIYPLPDG